MFVSLFSNGKGSISLWLIVFATIVLAVLLVVFGFSLTDSFASILKAAPKP